MAFVLYGFVCPNTLFVAMFENMDERDRARQILMDYNLPSDVLGPDALLVRMADAGRMGGIPRLIQTLFDWHRNNPGAMKRALADSARMAAAYSPR